MPLTHRVTEPTLHIVLREEMSERKMGVQQLADAIGVKYGVASRWVAEDEAKRVVPQPRTLVQLAKLFDLSVTDVFEYAGYLPVRNGAEGRDPEIDIRLRRLGRILKTIPPQHRSMALSIADSILDLLKSLTDRFLDL